MRLLLVFFIFLYSTFNAKAQVPIDSLQDHQEVELDTVIVFEDPHVITKPLVLEYVKVAKVYFTGYISMFKSFNYYSPCEGCEEYLEKHKASTTPLISSSIGTEVNFVPGKKAIWSVGAEYSSIREKFSYTPSNGILQTNINTNTYATVRLSSGYWLGRQNKAISFILSGGFQFSRLLSAKGIEIDYSDEGKIKAFSESIFRKNQYSITLGSKFIFLPSRRIKFYLEPNYQGNIRDCMIDPYMYLKLHNILGVRWGFIYSM